MEILALVLSLILLVVLVLWFTRERKWPPTTKPCTGCGGRSWCGYSEHSEDDPEKMTPLCAKCLVSQLNQDYAKFSGRALIVQPAEGPPCYVFHFVQEWRVHFKKSRIADDVSALLENMELGCHECDHEARFLWVDSLGLTAENFGEVLDKGISETLLPHNPKPVSLCAQCCVVRIAKHLEEMQQPYLEVSAPKGSGLGFVVPMAY